MQPAGMPLGRRSSSLLTQPRWQMKRPITREPIQAKAGVTFSIPKAKLFVGSYHRIPIRFNGVVIEDVNFIIPDGAKAAVISPSRDMTFNPKRPHIMLCVGYEPGTYIIEARHAATLPPRPSQICF
jgi:hypothetical protein